MAEKNPAEKVITRRLKFSHLDPHMARFHIEPVMNKAGDADRDIRSKLELVLQRSCFPEVFEPTEEDVTGEMVVKFSINKKKKEA